MKKNELIVNNVPGLKGVCYGDVNAACFVEAYEVYSVDDDGRWSSSLCFVGDKNDAKVFIGQLKNGDKPFTKHRKVVLLKIHDQYLLLEDYSPVSLEKTKEIKKKLFEGIKSKLTEEELALILDSIGQSTE